jgi:hypothetical protein
MSVERYRSVVWAGTIVDHFVQYSLREVVNTFTANAHSKRNSVLTNPCNFPS